MFAQYDYLSNGKDSYLKVPQLFSMFPYNLPVHENPPFAENIFHFN